MHTIYRVPTFYCAPEPLCKLCKWQWWLYYCLIIIFVVRVNQSVCLAFFVFNVFLLYRSIRQHSFHTARQPVQWAEVGTWLPVTIFHLASLEVDATVTYGCMHFLAAVTFVYYLLTHLSSAYSFVLYTECYTFYCVAKTLSELCKWWWWLYHRFITVFAARVKQQQPMYFFAGYMILSAATNSMVVKGGADRPYIFFCCLVKWEYSRECVWRRKCYACIAARLLFLFTGWEGPVAAARGGEVGVAEYSLIDRLM